MVLEAEQYMVQEKIVREVYGDIMYVTLAIMKIDLIAI